MEATGAQSEVDRHAADGPEPDLERAVRAVLAATRPGDVVAYGEVATEAGWPGRARAVGRVLAADAGDLPWWRVVNASGRLAPGKEEEQGTLLRAEGVDVVGSRVRQNDGPAPPEESPMAIYDHPVRALDGSAADLHELEGKAVLVVNVASKCGLTPQYEGLERLQRRYADAGFTVAGFPCNQFLGQEPGSAEEIQTFCSTTYGVSFPLYEKIDVNGDQRHPLYGELTKTADAEGHDGDIRWNFEKFLVGPDGEVRARFAPQVEPEDPQVVEAIEDALPQG